MGVHKIHNAIEEHYLKWQAKCRSIAAHDVADDLLHFLCLEILEMDKAYVIESINNGEFNSLANRIMYVSLNSKNSRFYYQYRKDRLNEDDILNYEIGSNDAENLYYNKELLSLIEREQGWYALKVLELIEVEGWSMVELSKRSGIPRASLAHAKSKLKSTCRKKYRR